MFRNDYTEYEVFPRVFVALDLVINIERAARGVLVGQYLMIME